MSLPLFEVFAALFFLGICVGSFLNVCIYRVPVGESIVSPASRCPSCFAPIRWFQNIPVVSYVLLRGRCANCRVSISWRYPAIESLTGALFAAVFWRFGFHAATPIYLVFIALLVVITFIDLDHQIIPDVISLPGIVTGFLGSFFLPGVNWSGSLLGILAGGGSLYLVAAGYKLLTGKDGMGGGDIKLLAMIGAFLGWKAILPVILISSLLGALVGVFLMLLRQADSKRALPYGPFLSVAALVQLFVGNDLIRWYLTLFQM